MSDTTLYIPTLVDRNKWRDYRQEVWGDSYNWHFARTTDQVECVAIHHSVTTPTSQYQNDVDKIALIHKSRGWNGIGYHFVITADGMVWYVGDVGMARANVLDMNEKVIGVCLVGDFTKYNPTDDQILSAHDLCDFFIMQHAVWKNLSDWTHVVGHKELQSTACPGVSWKGAPDSMYERIKNRIPYTPVPESPSPSSTPSSSPSPTPSPSPSSTVSMSSSPSPSPSVGECSVEMFTTKEIVGELFKRFTLQK